MTKFVSIKGNIGPNEGKTWKFSNKLPIIRGINHKGIIHIYLMYRSVALCCYGKHQAHRSKSDNWAKYGVTVK